MSRSRKKLFLLLGLSLVVIVFLLGWGGAYLISSPDAGEAIAASHRITYPAIIAHRGASYLAPEMTKPAYMLACEMGADYIEMDVQRSKDGVLVATHDTELCRTTDIEKVFPQRARQSLANFTLAELQRLDAGSWFNRRYPQRARRSYHGLKIMTLEQILAIGESTQPKLPGIYLETKSPHLYPGIEEQIVALLQKRGWISASGQLDQRRVIFQSFAAASAEKFKRLAPGVPSILLAGSKEYLRHGRQVILTQASKVDGMGIGKDLAMPWLIGPAHTRKLLVHVYTVNSLWEMKLLRQFGADGFFTDRCELALPYFGKSQAIDLKALFARIQF